MATPIERKEEKWYRNAIARVKKFWVDAVKSSDSLEAFINKIARVAGVSPETVRSSIAAKNWADFQAHAEEYLDDVIAGIEEAYRQKKWSKHWIRAFTTSA